MERFQIRKQMLLRVVTHSFHELPREACGLLVLVKEEITAQPCQNDATDDSSFDICVKDLERWHNSGLRMVGTYHSHPRGVAVPSKGDEELLEPNKLHLIVGMRGGLHVQLWQFRAPGQAPRLLDLEIIGV